MKVLTILDVLKILRIVIRIQYLTIFNYFDSLM